MPDPNHALEKLEERLQRALKLFKQTHADRRTLQQEVERLRADLKDRPKRFDAMERDLQVLRREREDVRNRIEKLIEQLDLLTKSESDG